jgi:DNA-binding LacI/PurR family transcriptional regulator
VGHYSFAGASAAARELLSRKARPDAIFRANHHTAIAAIEVARHEFGIDVGREVSIVGFDDVGAARWPSYGLTTFSQPVAPMVDETIAILMDLIEQRSRTPRQSVIEGDLMIRSSARVPPHGVVETSDGHIWRPEKSARKR